MDPGDDCDDGDDGDDEGVVTSEPRPVIVRKAKEHIVLCSCHTQNKGCRTPCKRRASIGRSLCEVCRHNEAHFNEDGESVVVNRPKRKSKQPSVMREKNALRAKKLKSSQQDYGRAAVPEAEAGPNSSSSSSEAGK